MTLKEKKNHVDNILKSNDLFDDLPEIDKELIHHRPCEDSWTIHEHIVHCMEVDIANFTRYRKGIVNPGAEITSMDGSWTEKLNYASIDIRDAIKTIKLVRTVTHSHLSSIIDEDWKEYSFLYDKYGVLDYETVIPVFSNHPIAHRVFIDRNIQQYKEGK